MTTLLFLMLLLGVEVSLGHARPETLAWDYASPPPGHRGFILQVCPWRETSCVMRDSKRLGPDQRQVIVEVHPRRPQCFGVLALVGRTRTALSNQVCFAE